MKSMKELREMMCEELEDIARKGELGAGDLEIVHKLTDTIKNIDKIDMLESEGGYSSGGLHAACMMMAEAIDGSTVIAWDAIPETAQKIA